MRRLRWWYINSFIGGIGQAYGTVYADEDTEDGEYIRTGCIMKVVIDGKYAIIKTIDCEYRCLLSEARYAIFDECGRKALGDFDTLRKRYEIHADLADHDGDVAMIVTDNDAEYGLVAGAARYKGIVKEVFLPYFVECGKKTEIVIRFDFEKEFGRVFDIRYELLGRIGKNRIYLYCPNDLEIYTTGVYTTDNSNWERRND